jgi:hypothetical protein
VEKDSFNSLGRQQTQDDHKKPSLLSSVSSNDLRREENIVQSLLDKVKRQTVTEDTARKALKRKTESTLSLSASKLSNLAVVAGQFRTCRSEPSMENLVKIDDENDVDVILIDDDADDGAASDNRRSARVRRSCKVARRQCNQGVSYAELSLSEESSGAEDSSRSVSLDEELSAKKNLSLKKPDSKQRTSRLRFVL